MIRRSLGIFLLVCFAMSVGLSASVAKDVTDYRPRPAFIELPQPAANPPEIGVFMRRAAASDTTLLGWWQFETPAGEPDEQGWTKVDKTAQEKTYFHVNGPACSDITAVSGLKSMWCGQRPNLSDPWCDWAALPGYGRSWDQSLVTPEIAMPASMTYTAVWDSEPGYDRTFVEYWDDASDQWVAISTVNGGLGYYEYSGGPVVETVASAATAVTRFRFHFTSDGAFDNRDGLYPSDQGAFKADDITTTYGDPSTVVVENFEDESCDALVTDDGFWTAEPAPGYGIFAHLTSGAAVIQEDPCRRLTSFLWAFFDDPLVTNYECGGFAHQAAMPYGPDENGLYLDNEIWSPWVPLAGSGDEYQFEFLTYRDLPLDNLQFYKYHIRTRGPDGCAGQWEDFASDLYYGGQKDWHRFTLNISSLVGSGAVDIQLAIGAWDGCRWYCGVYGTGACHSHAPLIDQVKLVRIDVEGPQWNVRHIDLWQDNFPEEGGVDPATGYTRCDMAQDILPSSNGSILPGDSIAVDATDPNGFAVDNTGGRPGVAIYAFVKVTDRFGNPKAGKSGTAIQSPDNQSHSSDPNAGLVRWPYVSGVAPAGWDAYRMDRCYTPNGGVVADRFCCDLMDLGSGATGPHYNHVNENTAANTGIFTPGDVINYILAAKNSLGQWSYIFRTFDGQGETTHTRDLNEALADPMEWSVLPDAGLFAGDVGDILFVDDADDRGGPAQLYVDWAFRYLILEDRADRFDVLGPSSNVGNSLASRVKNIQNQMIGDPVEIYQAVLWNSSDLSAGLMGDGGMANGGSGPEKSDDYALADFFLNYHPDNPGWAAWGDNMAEEWATLTGAGAVNVKSVWMTHTFLGGDHKLLGEAVSPVVYQNAGSPIRPTSMYAYGGCPVINDFDVMSATGGAFDAMSYGAVDATNAAVVAQRTPNGAGTDARYVLAGFGYNYIRDDGLDGALDRVTHMRDVNVFFQNVIDEPIGIDPVAFSNSLDNAYPNPFNPTTTIKYSIAERGHVSLKIYNAAGQLVRNLVDETQSPQATQFAKTWNGLNDAGQPVSSGVYFYKLTAENFTQTKKMVLLK